MTPLRAARVFHLLHMWYEYDALGVEKGLGAVSRPRFKLGRPEMHRFLKALRSAARQGRRLQFAFGLGAFAIALVSSTGLLPTATFAQVQFASRPIRLSSPQQLCRAEFINRIAGAVLPDSPLIGRPVHVRYYEGGVDDRPGMNLVLVLLSFEHMASSTIEHEFRAMLDALNYEVKRNLEIKGCRVYSKSAQERLSFSHPYLISSGFVFASSFPLLRVHAYYPTPRTPESRPLRRTGQPAPGKSRAAERTPARQAKQSKADHTADEKSKKVASSGAKAPAAVGAPPPSAPPVGPKVVPDPATAAPDAVPEKGTSIAALPPNAPEVAGRPPEVQRKSLKRYPRPNYKERAEPLRGIEALHTTKERVKRAVFAVEEIQCGEDGNWLVGYAGHLELVPGEDVKVLLTQRHALNNYPGEGVATLDVLRNHYADAGGLKCDPGGRECDGPTFVKESYAGYRQALLAARTSRTRALSDPPRYSCRPDQGICISQEREHWRCNPDGNCLSYDPTRWWCAWRQEFCFSRVKFGDWASPIKQNDVVRLKLDGSAPELMYDMSDGFLRIAQDALTRICGPGETKLWKANWASPK